MRYFRVLVTVAWLAAPIVAGAQPQPQPSPDEFVSISEVPAEEQIPAINLVAAAYAFVWLALFGYVWSLGTRLHKTEAELTRLERKDR
jgi:CcmD family protein